MGCDIHPHIEFHRDTDDPKCMDHPGFCSLDDLRRWNGRLWNEHRAIHPDWHTPSWLTTYEFAQVVEQYNQILKEAHPLAQATLDLMQSLDRSGLKARLVFWFDN